MTKRKGPPALAVEDDEGEGEPQTMFLSPSEGGSYIRNKDGSLTRVEHPTKRPDDEPQPTE